LSNNWLNFEKLILAHGFSILKILAIMIIENNKQIFNVMEQSNVSRLPQFEIIAIEGLQFKTWQFNF
jgi:hypothetical protein